MKTTLFLCLLASLSFSQVDCIHRYSQRPEIVTKIASEPMKFNMDQDTVLVGIYADSLETGYDIKMYVHFPDVRKIGGYWVNIGFPDGTFLNIQPVINNEHYAEFAINAVSLEKLKNNRFDYLSFDTNGLSEPCTRIRTKDFFINFFNKL